MASLQVLLVFLYLAETFYCAEYYVKPDSSSTCPTNVEPCLTFSEYLQNSIIYFTPGSTFTLLQGQHHLNQNLALSGVTNVTFRGQDPEMTIISIAESGRIIGSNLEDVGIISMKIQHQGGSQTSHTALIFQNSTVKVSNVMLVGANSKTVYSQGIRVVQSTVSFINCSFTHWHSINGGAVYIDESEVTFLEYTTFKNNTANFSGGGVYAGNSSTVNFIGTNVFEDNKAQTHSGFFDGGAGLFSDNSIIYFNGISNFARNRPLNDQSTSLLGGAINIYSSELRILNMAFFIENYGNYASVIYGNDSDILLEGITTFSYNRIGGTISLFRCNFTCIGKAVFTNNEIVQNGFGSAMFSRNSTIVFDADVLFANNFAHEGVGGALFISDSSIHYQGNVTFVNNSAQMMVGGGIYIEISILESSGNITFKENVARQGGGVYAVNSIINITGVCSFVDNIATDGGGMALQDRRNVIVLHSPAAMSFNGNRAISKGGALFFESNRCNQRCFFQIEAENLFTLQNVKLNFEKNSAGLAGSVLHGSYLEDCSLTVNSKTDLTRSKVLNISNTNNVPKFSSDPVRICFCNDTTLDCNQSNRIIHANPGIQFNMSVVALGLRDIPVNSTIQAFIQNDDESTTALQPKTVEGRCTNISFNIFIDTTELTLLNLYSGGICSTSYTTYVIFECPPGFTLKNSRCTCSENRLMEAKVVNCTDTETLLIQRQGNSWIDIVNDSMSSNLSFVYHTECPPNFCKPKNEKILLFFTNYNSNILCSSNRDGTLCGACRDGYSLTLHSFSCIKCEDRYISLLLFFALAGVALMAVLLVLHMTVAAGTINGLILYANIVNVNRIILFPPHISFHRSTAFLSVFISWLNLDFGIQTCFFNGLDSYSYAWLEYVFPVYIWFLIGAIIICNKISAKVGKLFGSNPVAVLATIILMSYTKLLQAAIVTLSPTTLMYTDGSTKRVWLYDANIEYFVGKHIPLAIVALFVIVFLLFPYIFLVLFGYCLQAYSEQRAFSWLNKFKPLLDAYYAPYRAKSRYWPGLMLLVRSCLYTAFSATALSNNSTNLVSISTVFTAIALIPWLSHRIYEKFYNEVLEASFILNICLLSTITYHVRAIDGDQERNQEIVTFLSISVALLQFLGIVAFHIYIRIKNMKLSCNFHPYTKKSTGKSQKEEITPTKKPVQTTFIELREPLLED